jgi:hypothetical protein
MRRGTAAGSGHWAKLVAVRVKCRPIPHRVGSRSDVAKERGKGRRSARLLMG